MTPPESRIPLLFAHWSSAKPGEVVLVAAPVPAPDGVGIAIWGGEHGAACTCCGGQSRPARVLSALFVGAMRGDRARFSAVVADLGDTGDAALRDALRTDRFLAARYVMDQGRTTCGATA